MAGLADIVRENPGLYLGKTIMQLVGIAGDGNILHDDTSREFRAFLQEASIEDLQKYLTQCMETKDTKSDKTVSFVLQDLVNEAGRRFGFEVENGRYKGVKGEIGNDGLWRDPTNNNAFILEVKKSASFKIDVATIDHYRQGLIAKGTIRQGQSYILIVAGEVARTTIDTVRGSNARDIARILGIPTLISLLSLVNAHAQDRIRQLLTPVDFMLLDNLVPLVFPGGQIPRETRPIEPTDQELEALPPHPANLPSLQNEKRVGDFIYHTLQKLSEEGYVFSKELEGKLKDPDYSRATFHISPRATFLLDTKPEQTNEKDYWLGHFKGPLPFGDKTYWFYKQWFARQKDFFITWYQSLYAQGNVVYQR